MDYKDQPGLVGYKRLPARVSYKAPFQRDGLQTPLEGWGGCEYKTLHYWQGGLQNPCRRVGLYIPSRRGGLQNPIVSGLGSKALPGGVETGWTVNLTQRLWAMEPHPGKVGYRSHPGGWTTKPHAGRLGYKPLFLWGGRAMKQQNLRRQCGLQIPIQAEWIANSLGHGGLQNPCRRFELQTPSWGGGLQTPRRWGKHRMGFLLRFQREK